MAALARQSLGFADATQQVDVPALQQQIRQLQMRLVAEQQCVLREQHITARMWIEKSQAEECADALQSRCEELQATVSQWEAWQQRERRQQRLRRQQALQRWTETPEELLAHLMAYQGLASAQSLPAEQRCSSGARSWRRRTSCTRAPPCGRQGCSCQQGCSRGARLRA